MMAKLRNLTKRKPKIMNETRWRGKFLCIDQFSKLEKDMVQIEKLRPHLLRGDDEEEHDAVDVLGDEEFVRASRAEFDEVHKVLGAQDGATKKLQTKDMTLLAADKLMGKAKVALDAAVANSDLLEPHETKHLDGSDPPYRFSIPMGAFEGSLKKLQGGEDLEPEDELRLEMLRKKQQATLSDDDDDDGDDVMLSPNAKGKRQWQLKQGSS